MVFGVLMNLRRIEPHSLPFALSERNEEKERKRGPRCCYLGPSLFAFLQSSLLDYLTFDLRHRCLYEMDGCLEQGEEMGLDRADPFSGVVAATEFLFSPNLNQPLSPPNKTKQKKQREARKRKTHIFDRADLFFFPKEQASLQLLSLCFFFSLSFTSGYERRGERRGQQRE